MFEKNVNFLFSVFEKHMSQTADAVNSFRNPPGKNTPTFI